MPGHEEQLNKIFGEIGIGREWSLRDHAVRGRFVVVWYGVIGEESLGVYDIGGQRLLASDMTQLVGQDANYKVEEIADELYAGQPVTFRGCGPDHSIQLHPQYWKNFGGNPATRLSKGMELSEMIAYFNFDWVDPRITDENFPRDRIHYHNREPGGLIGFNGNQTGLEVLEWSVEHRIWPLKLDQLLFDRYGGLMGTDLVALCSHFEDEGDRKRYTPHIVHAREKRRVELIRLDLPMPKGSFFAHDYEQVGKPFDMTFRGSDEEDLILERLHGKGSGRSEHPDAPAGK